MNTTLLVLDFINDIVHPDGKIAGSAPLIQERQIIEHANRIIKFAREQHIPIVFVKVGFSADYQECPENSPIFGKAKQAQVLQLNTWGTEFHEKVDVKKNDVVMVKHRVSAFYATPLEAFLSARQIQSLIITGVSTDMAVQTTAREAHDRDYKVTIISDACGAQSQELHENALKSLARIATVITTDEFLKKKFPIK